MYVFLPLLFLILSHHAVPQTAKAVAQASAEVHYSEAGTAPILMRSAFAHGYRHGYEEGYHHGNIDINMGRQPHTRFSQLRDLSMHYSPEFGPRKSFDAGFQQGVRAGYMDGFAGRMFRALENLRSIAMKLDQQPAQTDPRNLHFDQGFSAGYERGVDSSLKQGTPPEKIDPSMVQCSGNQANQMREVAQGTFCDGYRRGFVLGHADGMVLGPNPMVLASRK